MKVTVVGGASTYTPELVDGIARLRDVLPVDTLVLADPAGERLEVVGGHGPPDAGPADHPAQVVTTTDIDAGVTDSDAVLLQLRVGGQAARMQDEAWPLECGCIGQETTGAGGLAKALRTVPGRARHRRDGAQARRGRRLDRRLHQPGRHRHPGAAQRRAPGGRAVQRRDRLPALVRRAARGLARRRSQLGHVGLNHLTWERSVTVDGRDVLPELLERHAAADRRAGRASRRAG